MDEQQEPYDDSCIECKAPSICGVIGFRDGTIYHKHFCKPCYHKYKMRFSDSEIDKKLKKKPKPSKIEKEFKDAGLRVQAKNSGTQLVIAKKFTRVDYWPTTQRWYNRNTGESGIGKEGVFPHFGL